MYSLIASSECQLTQAHLPLLPAGRSESVPRDGEYGVQGLGDGGAAALLDEGAPTGGTFVALYFVINMILIFLLSI